ncbi:MULTISPECIES: rhamnulokinase [unclassified Streptosporangium]|uniref:rhamnulokinase n=1 Tax=unclassified Streptosporangium TaxID=2632669 RepID=UPI002E28B50F|nr:MULTISPECIES: rhamnulokinase family protein [unclassified Streptosporangium]
MPVYVAVDLGPESGRVLTGEFDGERLAVREVHRFANRPARVLDGLYWDVLGLLTQARGGIALAAARGRLTSVGVSAWGGDFALLDRDGRLLANPRHHLDPYTSGLAGLVSWQDHYELTGVHPGPGTTACQLLAHAGSPLLEAADHLAMMPDLFTLWLSGEMLAERTIASTSQLLDARTGRWAGSLVTRLGLPRHLFADRLTEPGTVAGPLRGESGGNGRGPGATMVVAVAGHDAASATAALPVSSGSVGYISFGPRSLAGLELDAPVTSREARMAGFTNEGGVTGTVRFTRALNGLQLLQECRKAWGVRTSYADLVAEAATAPAFGPLIDPGHPWFLEPGNVPARIAAYCRSTGQTPPAGRAQTVRCLLESLACSYRWALEQAEFLSDRRVEAVHLVGGGASSDTLCRLVADFAGRPVLAGPVEATAVGNLLVQAMADGRVGSLTELREVVRRSFRPRPFPPAGQREPYEIAYSRYRQLTGIDGFWNGTGPEPAAGHRTRPARHAASTTSAPSMPSTTPVRSVRPVPSVGLTGDRVTAGADEEVEVGTPGGPHHVVDVRAFPAP